MKAKGYTGAEKHRGNKEVQWKLSVSIYRKSAAAHQTLSTPARPSQIEGRYALFRLVFGRDVGPFFSQGTPPGWLREAVEGQYSKRWL